MKNGTNKREWPGYICVGGLGDIGGRCIILLPLLLWLISAAKTGENAEDKGKDEVKSEQGRLHKCWLFREMP